MAQIRIEIPNLNEVLDSFQKLGDDARSVLHAGVNKGADALAPKIQMNIPVGTDSDRHLRDAIKVRKAKPKKSLKQSADIVVGKGSEDYGFHVETGHDNIPPQPFMRSTTDKHQAEISEIVLDEILDRLGL